MEFNYDKIEDGFYDKIFDAKDGVRKFWHWHKFDSVIRSITVKLGRIKLLDIGCFSGSFAGRFLDDQQYESASIDILPSQIKYAQEHYQNPNRKFIAYQDFKGASELLAGETFDVITFIEVIEHLTPEQIYGFFNLVDQVSHAGTQIIITTPNYTSLWPILEIILNRVSDVKYDEQHITKFHYWNIVRKMEKIYPPLLEKFELELLTSSHLLTPYLPLFSYKFAQKISKIFRPSRWMSPFGSILIIKFKKRKKAQ